LKIYISQGSVATQLRCGGNLVTNLLQIFQWMCWWEKIWKSYLATSDVDRNLRLTFW